MKQIFLLLMTLCIISSCGTKKKSNAGSGPSIASISDQGEVTAFSVGQPIEPINEDPNVVKDSLVGGNNEKRDSILKEILKMNQSIDYPYLLLVDSSGFKLGNGGRIWTDNLDQLVGTIIQIDPQNREGTNVQFRILNNILGDTVKPKTKIYTPKFSDSKNTTIKKDRAASFSFLGINPNIKNEQLYTLSQSSVAGVMVGDRDIDTLKIPAALKCTLDGRCNSFVIMGAEVVKFDTRLYTARTKALKVKDFPLVSQAFGNGSELQISTNSSSDQQQTNYYLYVALKGMAATLRR